LDVILSVPDPAPPPPADVIVEKIDDVPHPAATAGGKEPPAPPAPIVIGIEPPANTFVPPGKEVL
jgi:hypothetical protein